MTFWGRLTVADKTKLDGIAGETQTLHRFPRASDGTWELAVSYSAKDRKITLTPSGASFDFYVDGVKFTKTGAQTSGAHADTDGGHYFYYDTSGDLQTSTSAWSILGDPVPVAYVLYCTSASAPTRTVASSAWSVTSNVQTITVGSGHGIVADDLITFDTVTAAGDIAVAARVTSVGATTIVVPNTTGDASATEAGTITVLTERGICLFELHTTGMDRGTHKRLHDADGTRIVSGFAISGYTLNTASDAAVSYAIASGVVADEDISRTTTALSDGGPYAVLRRYGASGIWRWSTIGNSLPFLYGTYPQWNQLTGGSWQMTDVTSGNFCRYYVFATTSVDAATQIVLIPGQAQYATQALADASSYTDLSFGAVPLTELAPLYALTFEGKTGNAGTAKAKLVTVQVLVGTRFVSAGSIATSNAAAITSAAGTNTYAVTGNVQGDLNALDAAIVVVSDDDPLPAALAADPGVSADASRSDHVHPTPVSHTNIVDSISSSDRNQYGVLYFGAGVPAGAAYVPRMVTVTVDTVSNATYTITVNGIDVTVTTVDAGGGNSTFTGTVDGVTTTTGHVATLSAGMISRTFASILTATKLTTGVVGWYQDSTQFRVRSHNPSVTFTLTEADAKLSTVETYAYSSTTFDAASAAYHMWDMCAGFEYWYTTVHSTAITIPRRRYIWAGTWLYNGGDVSIGKLPSAMHTSSTGVEWTVISSSEVFATGITDEWGHVPIWKGNAANGIRCYNFTMVPI
jgi:hypothetical protein